MKSLTRPFLCAPLFLLAWAISRPAQATEDMLPSWNDAAPKKAIVAFVQRVTTAGSLDCCRCCASRTCSR